MEEQSNLKGKDRIKEATAKSIDDFNIAVKNTVERIVVACIEAGIQVFHDTADNYSNRVKHKLKGLNNNDKLQNRDRRLR